MTEEVKKKDDIVCIGLDVGTMHLVCARSDLPEVKMTRNVFLKLDSEIQMTDLSEISYVENEDGNFFIIGSDAFTYANIFGKDLAPMESSNRVIILDFDFMFGK